MASSSYRRDNQSSRRPRDIKARTMNRLAALDADIASRYDVDDEDESRLPINQRSKIERQVEVINHSIRGRNTKMNRQVVRSAGGRRDMVYKVTVRNGGAGDADFIMEQLRELAEGIIPFNIGSDSNSNITFFVYSQEEAENLRMLSRRISHPSDPRNRFVIYHRSEMATWESLDPKIKSAIRDVVKERYIQGTNAIDLSNFQSHKIFIERDLRSLCSLSRNAVSVEAVRAIAELYPAITGLSLKNNRLTMLNYAQSFVYACPNVKELDLSDNNLDDVKELKKISQWQIERLFLENNPMCSAFSNASSYTSAVHDYLPLVDYLDGTTVQRDPFKVRASNQRRSGIMYPPIQASYFPDQDLKRRVEQLLVEYFTLYDKQPAEKSRQALVNAYDENATFTYAIHNLPEPGTYRPKSEADPAFAVYLRSSHNLCHEDKWERYREKIVYKGAMAIAVAISQLPSTQHDQGSFQLEFVTLRRNLLVFTLRGILRDGIESPTGSFKFFSRTFTVVPRDGDRMAIVNDDLMLTPISQERYEKYSEQLRKMLEMPPEDPQPGPSGISLQSTPISMSQLAVSNGNGPGPSGLQQILQQPMSNPIPQMQQQPMAQVTPIAPQPSNVQTGGATGYNRDDPEIRRQMIEAFSQQSGMKAEWSEKCLEELKWDYEAAGQAFLSMRATIPPDAFM